MKKVLKYHLIGLLFLLVCLPINAYDFESEGIFYKINGGSSTVSVTYRSYADGYYQGDISIPSIVSYNGENYEVTDIGEYAFTDCSAMTSILIPNSVKSIENGAFYKCSGLTSIVIPSSVTNIGPSVFFFCSGLTSISVDAGNRVYDSRNNCNAIIETASNTLIWGCMNTNIPNSVTRINETAFNGCSGLTSIIIPNSVTSIGSRAFNMCSGLTSLVLSSSMTSIGYYVFSCCTSLESVSIPNSITTIGSGAFQGCSSLSSVTIPNSVTQIGFAAFAGCSSLSSITIPNSVKSIGIGAFSECSGLSSLEIPNSVISIGTQAFTHCEGLTSISVDAGNSVYDSRDNCNAIIMKDTLIAGCMNTSIPNSIFKIGNDAFSGCSGLTSITIPSSVKSIGKQAFSYCTGLTSITIPNSVTSIGNYAFWGCSGLTSIVSEIENPFTIDDKTFYSDDKDIYATATLTVPAGTKTKYQSTEGWNQFKNVVEAGGGSSSEEVRRFESGGITYIVNDNGTTVTVTAGNNKYKGDISIPSSVSYNGKNYDVTSIGYAAFGDCTGLTSISIPNSIGYIQYGAFQNCSGLSSITLPNSIKSIAQYAFIGCSNLTKIVSEIESPFSLEGSTFDNSTFNNATLTVPAGKKSLYQSTGGWMNFKNIVEVGSEQGGNIGEEFEFDGIYYKIEDNNSVSVARTDFRISGEIVIPNQVTYNGKTYNVIAIGYGAFSDYHKVTSIVIPNSVITIDDYAFSNSNIESVTIPNSVKSIGVFAFYDCSLTSIIIPNSVTSIGDNAFFINYNLKTIVSEIEKPFIISDNVFDDAVYSTATLTIPAGTRSKYQATNGWKLFKNILEEGETDMVEFTIDGATYTGSKSSQSVALKTVDTSLTSVEIPASISYDGTNYMVTGIGDNAFVGCTMAALVWNVDNSLPSNAFSSALIGSNFLLYVNSASYAPSTVRNVIVNGTASSITLSDNGGNFYCPKSFNVQKISYSHHYSMETGGNGKGWETIALPFGVETISHATRGEIVPFAAYSQNSGKKPLWLCKFGSNGFVRTNSIQAYTPYLIAMPNQPNYDNNYILAGEVTFTSENVNIPATPTFSGTFVPTFSTVPKAANVYALNVVNRYVNDTGGYDAGSKFISKLRNVRPFEAYISQSSSTRGIYDIDMEDGTTSMDGVLSLLDPDREIDVYTLSGQKVKRVKQGDLDDEIEQLPHGVYIVNGQKVLR